MDIRCSRLISQTHNCNFCVKFVVELQSERFDLQDWHGKHSMSDGSQSTTCKHVFATELALAALIQQRLHRRRGIISFRSVITGESWLIGKVE